MTTNLDTMMVSVTVLLSSHAEDEHHADDKEYKRRYCSSDESFEAAHIPLADALGGPRTVMVKHLDAIVAVRAMLSQIAILLILDDLTYSAVGFCLYSLDPVQISFRMHVRVPTRKPLRPCHR